MRVKKQAKCSIWWCDREYYAKGYCHTHVTAVQRYGSPYGRHQEEFKRIDDIIHEVRTLIDEIHYPPGPTRESILFAHSSRIKDKIGEV